MAKLYIVGTPIGNLKDITLRALETLKSVDIIACEDTRHSLGLLNHYEIKARLVAYHKFNEKECGQYLIGEIEDGKNVAIITDAGMPAISDPGAVLVKMCREKGVAVEVVPGPTAFASAVAMSGIESTGFTFLGFMPEKKKLKVALLSKYAKSEVPVIFYVAPHDLKKTASDIKEIFGDRKVYVVREITKLHECVTITTLGDFEAEERGEIVMIVEGVAPSNPLQDMTIEEHLLHYINEGMDKKEAVKKVSQERAIPKNEVYQIALGLEL